MQRRPPRSTLSSSSAASDGDKRQVYKINENTKAVEADVYKTKDKAKGLIGTKRYVAVQDLALDQYRHSHQQQFALASHALYQY